MANETKTGSVQSGQAAGKGPSTPGSTTGRKRKVYDHEMTQAENFALQTVQRATSALRTINDAIKSGKKVNPDVIKLCFELSKAAGDMLFSDG